MAIFYTTLLYFFMFLALDRLKYLDMSKNLADIPQYLILLGILLYLILSLVNIIIVRNKKKYKFNIKLGYIKKYQGKMIINLGAGIIPIFVFFYFYPRSAFIPFLVAIFICISIGLMIYQSNKNVENKLPVFTSMIISIIAALFLTPANPAFLMISVFVGASMLLIVINILLMHKKTPLYIGEKNFYHALFILILFSLVV